MAMQFDRDAWYSEYQLRQAGAFTEPMLAKARKAGELRYKEPSRGRRYYKGLWLLAWLHGHKPRKK
jgi:hypothetical protein